LILILVLLRPLVQGLALGRLGLVLHRLALGPSLCTGLRGLAPGLACTPFLFRTCTRLVPVLI